MQQKKYSVLKILRKKRRLSQQAIADLLEVSQVAYSKYETGKSDPSTNVLKKLADFYNVSIDYILEQTSVPERIEDFNISGAYLKMAKSAQDMGISADDVEKILSIIASYQE